MLMELDLESRYPPRLVLILFEMSIDPVMKDTDVGYQFSQIWGKGESEPGKLAAVIRNGFLIT